MPRLPPCLFAAVLAFAISATPAHAAQKVLTWDLTTKFATKADAVFGLSAADAANEGPTGVRVRVVLPDGYTPDHCWPVLYLLHGTGSATAWVGQTHRLARLKAIVVIPGTGNTQFVDWYAKGRRTPRWERWFFDELMPTVDQRLPICPERRYHSIAGMSAGGGAAYYLASQEPQRFGSAGSFSGTLNLLRPEVPAAWPGFYPIYGSPTGFYVAGKNPLDTLSGLRSTRLFMSYGDGQPVEGDPSPEKAGFQAAAEFEMKAQDEDFLAAAKRAGLPVHVRARVGMHNMTNWTSALRDMIAWDPFAPVPEIARKWKVTTVRPQGTIWGFSFRFSKPPTAVEQFTFDGHRLEVTGRGRVTIRRAGRRPVTAKLPFALEGSHAVEIGASGVDARGISPRRRLAFTPRHATPHSVLHITGINPPKPKKSRRLQLLIYSGTRTCNMLNFVNVRWRRGKRLHLTVRPPARPGKRAAWCPGTAIVTLQSVPRSSTTSGLGKILRLASVTIFPR